MHTRLWSMISAMTAILPVEGPALRRTTGPGEHAKCEQGMRQTSSHFDKALKVGFLGACQHIRTLTRTSSPHWPAKLPRTPGRRGQDGAERGETLTDMACGSVDVGCRVSSSGVVKRMCQTRHNDDVL